MLERVKKHSTQTYPQQNMLELIQHFEITSSYISTHGLAEALSVGERGEHVD